ncbi:MAG TPA: gluconate 2-dehydrogenase subunit 3 family protein [Sphingomonas sp.]|nr:gluconate 2-dehydrogenase subunit 3 family protein [Sphingomonas sp.]
MDRRALMRRAMILVAGAAMPMPVLAMPVGDGNFFSPAQLDVLAAYADTLIPETDTPGAMGAGVPLAVDAMMRDWASAETRKAFVSALDGLEAAARGAGGRSLAALPPSQRFAVVKAFDAARIGELKTAADASDAPLARPYGRLKELVMITYYLSEPGATQELRYELIPGEWNAEMPLGKDQRAWAV